MNQCVCVCVEGRTEGKGRVDEKGGRARGEEEDEKAQMKNSICVFHGSAMQILQFSMCDSRSASTCVMNYR